MGVSHIVGLDAVGETEMHLQRWGASREGWQGETEPDRHVNGTVQQALLPVIQGRHYGALPLNIWTERDHILSSSHT